MSSLNRTTAPSVANFVQMTPATTWTITHNLGGNASVPIVEVMIDYDGKVEKILPKSVTIIDANTIEVTFSNPHSGYATVLQ